MARSELFPLLNDRQPGSPLIIAYRRFDDLTHLIILMPDHDGRTIARHLQTELDRIEHHRPPGNPMQDLRLL
jgi:hypothetical protein